MTTEPTELGRVAVQAGGSFVTTPDLLRMARR